jgi:hypothetical protein
VSGSNLDRDDDGTAFLIGEGAGSSALEFRGHALRVAPPGIKIVYGILLHPFDIRFTFLVQAARGKAASPTRSKLVNKAREARLFSDPAYGWTRYRVKHGDGVAYVESVYFTRQECFRFLQGMVACKEWAPLVARLHKYRQ